MINDKFVRVSVFRGRGGTASAGAGASGEHLCESAEAAADAEPEPATVAIPFLEAFADLQRIVVQQTVALRSALRTKIQFSWILHNMIIIL